MGLTGQLSHPGMRAAIKMIKDKCRKAGLPYGIFGMTPESVADEAKEGCTFILCGVDTAIFVNSYSDLLKTLKGGE